MWRIPQRGPGEKGWTQSGDWQSLGTPADGLPWASTKIVLAQNSDARLEAAVIAGDDGAIWHAWQTEPGGGWSEWRSLGLPELRMGPPSTPAMMVNEDGRLELFTLADGAVWHRWQQRAARGPWHDWHPLGRPPGVTTHTTIAPTVARNVDGRLELFLALEGEVWHIWQTRVNNGWSDWSPLENPAPPPACWRWPVTARAAWSWSPPPTTVGCRTVPSRRRARAHGRPGRRSTTRRTPR